MAKKIYYGEKAFPGGMPRVAARNQGQTYYDGYPVISSDVKYYPEENPEGIEAHRSATAVFDDGSEFGYNVNTSTYLDGSKSVFEYGNRNGVHSYISNHYDQNGRRFGTDTTYNAL